jgi:imidazolonepropionase-like amidohydrolase
MVEDSISFPACGTCIFTLAATIMLCGSCLPQASRVPAIWAETSRSLQSRARRIESGELEGPHLVFAGPMLAGPPAKAGNETWIVRSPDEARHTVESLVTRGVDFIKVHDNLARDAYLAIADVAKAKGIPVAGHVSVSMMPAEVSDLGQKSIEHLEFLPKTCAGLFDPAARIARRIPPGCEPSTLQVLLRQFARNGTWLDPTIGSFHYFAPQQWPAIFAGFCDVAKQIRQSGVRVLAGTDQSSFLEGKGAAPGRSLHDELALLVEAGFTPAQALRAATSDAALFLGLGSSLGTIETGKIANLVLLEADPLQDIRNIKRIVTVIAEGRIVSHRGSLAKEVPLRGK